MLLFSIGFKISFDLFSPVIQYDCITDYGTNYFLFELYIYQQIFTRHQRRKHQF